MPASAMVCWIACAIEVISSVFLVSIVTENPSGRPASARSALARSTSSANGVSSSAPRKPLGRNAWWTSTRPFMIVSAIAA